MQSRIPIYLATAITVMIVIANFSVLIRMTLSKFKENRAKKAQEKRERIMKKLESRIKKKLPH